MKPDYEAIRRRLAAATPGRWVNMTGVIGSAYGVIAVNGDAVIEICQEPEYDDRRDDMDFIAHAPADIDALLARCQALEARACEARAILDQCVEVMDGTQIGQIGGIRAWLETEED